jgi:hypothetical protein
MSATPRVGGAVGGLPCDGWPLSNPPLSCKSPEILRSTEAVRLGLKGINPRGPGDGLQKPGNPQK